MKCLLVIFFCLSLCIENELILAYQIPQSILTKYPVGFKVSIPYQNGDTRFGFHGKKNQQMHGLEMGQYNLEINTIPSNGNWEYINTNEYLEHRDQIYFWIYVENNGKDYRRENGIFYIL